MTIKSLKIPPQIYVSKTKPNKNKIKKISKKNSHYRKPRGGLWTSTMYKNSQGNYTSEWIEWADGNISQYEKDSYYVWKCTTNKKCTIVELNNKKDVEEFGHLTKNRFDEEIYEFNWNINDIDGIWLTITGTRNLTGILTSNKYSMSSWDVESIVWSNWVFDSVEKLRKL